MELRGSPGNLDCNNAVLLPVNVTYDVGEKSFFVTSLLHTSISTSIRLLSRPTFPSVTA